MDGGQGMTQGYQLDHQLSLRLLEPFFDNLLLEHGGLPGILSFAVHLDIFVLNVVVTSSK